MILVTGGSGFIGSHTVRALYGLGEPSVVMQRRSGQVPAYLVDLPVVAEQADVADLDSLRAIGERHEITGIVHLAGYPAPRGTAGGIEATQGLLDGLLVNIARAAAEWGVPRVSLASTIGVYGGIQHGGPLTEDLPLLLTAPHPIPRSKKIAELPRGAARGGDRHGDRQPPDLRHPVSAADQDPFFAAPALIHAAASGKPLDLSGLLSRRPRRRARPVLRQRHRPRHSPDPARQPAQAPHLQRRVRAGDHERGGDRSHPRSRARGRTRPPGRRSPARRRSLHHPAPPGHRIRAGVRHRARGR